MSATTTAKATRVKKTVLGYKRLLKKRGLPAKDAWAELLNASNDIEKGKRTEDTCNLIALYEEVGPGPIKGDAAAERALFIELRVAATFFREG